MSKVKDLTGQRFGKLVAIRRVANNASNRVCWECECDCGNHVVVTTHELNSGHTKSCGNHNYEDLTGQHFGELTAIKKIGNDRSRCAIWLCKCSCGEECEYTSEVLKKSKTITCKSHYVNTMIGRTFGFLTVIDHSGYISAINKHMFLCKCQCGNIIEVSGNNLCTDHTRSCGCVGTSIGESHIKQILTDNRVNYTKNKTFEGCRFPDTGHYGFFDFYLEDDEFIVEFDGKQHFGYTGYNWNVRENYIKTHNHDLYKNQWAWDNGIPMKRIPFTERDTVSLDMIMSDQYLISPSTHPDWYPKDGSTYPYLK